MARSRDDGTAKAPGPVVLANLADLSGVCVRPYCGAILRGERAPLPRWSGKMRQLGITPRSSPDAISGSWPSPHDSEPNLPAPRGLCRRSSSAGAGRDRRPGA
jgi:hypothetical protein